MKMSVDAEAHLHQAVADNIKRSASTTKGGMFNSQDLEHEL